MGQTAGNDEVSGSTMVASLIREANRRGIRASRLLPAQLLRSIHESAGADAESASDRDQLEH